MKKYIGYVFMFVGGTFIRTHLIGAIGFAIIGLLFVVWDYKDGN